MAEYININNAYPITRYTNEAYSADGDNIPFTSIEDRSKWYASLYNQLGFYYVGNSSISANLINHTLVTINVSGQIAALSGLATSLPASSVVGIIYTLNEQALPLYSESTTGLFYYPVVMASDFLSIPITGSLFESTVWSAPSVGSRSYNAYMVGDYIYYDQNNNKMAAYPVTVTITSTDYLEDNEGKKIRLGKIVAKTNTNYVIKFNSLDMYGSSITFANRHQDLLDIVSQDVTACNTWVNSHTGYRPTILRTSLISATVGDVIGLHESTYEAYNNRGVVVGILAYSDATYSYLMVSGVWDSSVRGCLPTGLTLSTTDIGKPVWTSSTTGQTTITPPVDTTKTIIPIAKVIDTTQIFISIANGFNSYIETLSNSANNMNTPDAMESALELQQDFSGVEVEDITGTGDVQTNMRLRKIHTDSPVHIAPLTQTTGENNVTSHWFALTENSWINDCYTDYEGGSETTINFSKQYQGNDIQPYCYILYYNYDPYVPGLNGSYRLGQHNWTDAQSMDLSAIAYDDTEKTLTMSASSDTIYIWHSAKLLTDMAWNNQLPWVGLMMLVHDVTNETQMCLFSYEGYEGFDTDTFIFKNVNIYTKAHRGHTNLISNPTWTYNVSGSSWTEYTDTSSWKIGMYPIGGIRLKIIGNGTFNRISNTPPYGLKWSALKKGGSSVLGTVDTSSYGQLNWDSTNDVTAMFVGLTTDSDLQTAYHQLDYTSPGTGIISLSAYPTLIHSPAYHPLVINHTITTTAGVTDTLTYYPSWSDYVYTPEYVDATYGPTKLWTTWTLSTTRANSPIGALSGFGFTGQQSNQSNGTIIKFATSGATYYGITAAMTGTASGGGSRVLGPTSYGLTGTATITGYQLYTITDDIVTKASYIIDDDAKELWIDVSCKYLWRAFSVMFEMIDVKPSSMLEISPAQSHFNNMKNSLKSITVGCAMYSRITETDKILTYIQNRPTAPTLNI